MTNRSTCWLLYDSRGGAAPVVIEQFASLRGFRQRLINVASGPFPQCAVPQNHLFALSAATLEAMESSDIQNIANLVSGGATLYVRGGFQPDKAYPPVPFLEETFVVELSRAPCSYQVSSHTLISAAPP